MNRKVPTAAAGVSMSKEKLIAGSDDDESDNANQIAEVEVYPSQTDFTYEDKRYVMRKFLEINSPEAESILDQRPIPKRRTKVTTRVDRNNDVETESDISNISNATYDIKKPIAKKRDPQHNRTPPDKEKCKEVIEYENERKVPTRKKLTKHKHKLNDSSLDKRNEQDNEIIQIHDERNSPKSSVHDDEKDEKDVDQSINLNNVDKDDDCSEILILNILRTDRILLESYALHPAVRIYFINSENGDFIKKSDVRRRIHNSEYSLNSDYIDCVTTNTTNLIANRNLVSIWNEKIIINEDFKHLESNASFMLFFELIDISNEAASPKIIAWAFLKPTNNYNANSRLQLFYSHTLDKKATCNAYHWWKRKRLRKYPSTLYISLHATSMPNKIIKLWQATPCSTNQAEVESPRRIDAHQTITDNVNVPRKMDISNVLLSKKTEIYAYDEGCLVHRCSTNGDLLAMAVCQNNAYNILIYELCSMEEVCNFDAHQGLIHDIVWADSDRQLITASADGTVALWDMTLQKLEHVFPHPGFVYCCACTKDGYLVTGGYDKIIRMWSLTSNALLDELDVHQGYITSICFNKEDYFMYSADSIGCICMWQKEQDVWVIKQEIKILDLENVTINQLILHRRERKIIVNSRDGFVRLIDIKTGYVIMSFQRGSQEKSHIYCTTTPCGNYVIMGSESGDVYVWRIDNGQIVQTYSPYQIKIRVHCVQYSDAHNLMIMSHFGSGRPVIIYGLEGNATQPKLGNELASNSKQNGITDLQRIQSKGKNFRTILEKFDTVIATKY